MMKTEGHNPSVFVEYEWCEFLYEIPDDDYKIVERLKIKII